MADVDHDAPSLHPLSELATRSRSRDEFTSEVFAFLAASIRFDGARVRWGTEDWVIGAAGVGEPPIAGSDEGASVRHASGSPTFGVILFGPLRRRGEVLGTLSLHRAEGRDPFSAAEVAAFRGALPVVALGLALHRSDSPSGVHRRNPELLGLTPREREIVELLLRGHSNAQIAEACGTQPLTVRNQLVSIYRKLGAATRAEAVAIVLRSGRDGTGEASGHGVLASRGPIG